MAMLTINLNALPRAPQRGTPDGRLRFKRRLGEGAEGRVYFAVRADGVPARPVAVKVVSGAHCIRFQQLRGIWPKLRHPNIVSTQRVLYEARRGRAYVEMEWCESDLLRRITRRGGRGLSEFATGRYAAGIASALAHCHAQGIAHGDVKPENILIRRDGDVAKLCDFGSSIVLPTGVPQGAAAPAKDPASIATKPICSSPTYAAPEVALPDSWAGAADGEAELCPAAVDPCRADMWSLGVVIYTAAAGHFPWASASPADPAYHRFLDEKEAFFPPHFSPALRDLLVRLLCPEPLGRPSAAEVAADPWLAHAASAAPAAAVSSPTVSALSPTVLDGGALSTLGSDEEGAEGFPVGGDEDGDERLPPLSRLPDSSCDASAGVSLGDCGRGEPISPGVETLGGSGSGGGGDCRHGGDSFPEACRYRLPLAHHASPVKKRVVSLERRQEGRGVGAGMARKWERVRHAVPVLPLPLDIPSLSVL